MVVNDEGKNLKINIFDLYVIFFILSRVAIHRYKVRIRQELDLLGLHPLNPRDRFHMHTMAKLIHCPDLHQFIIFLTQIL